MFEIKTITKANIRLGEYSNKRKRVQTPAYFFISNIGGGGTNVSRMFSYFDLFSDSYSQLLLNYYYLNAAFEKTPGFDSDLLSELDKFNNILDFIESAKAIYQKRGRVSEKYRQRKNRYVPFVMLDSGSGNIFRDMVKTNKISAETINKLYEQLIKDYEDFVEKHSFDICIAMDIAEKYTKKQGEHTNRGYKDSLISLGDLKANMDLLALTLKNSKNMQALVFAPIHGSDPDSYLKFMNGVLDLEKKHERKFDGFAIGGLGKIKNKQVLYGIIKVIRTVLESKSDTRPIHVLGAGSLQNIIPMAILGADSFDCHSPWRRASEGKYVVPLLNSSLTILQNKNFWSYLPLNGITVKTYACDCPVCKEFSLDDLKKLYVTSMENQYYAKILLFKHNIYQQEQVCRLCREPNLLSIIKNFPDSKNKRVMLEQLSILH